MPPLRWLLSQSAPVVAVSPHLDDAALASGGTLAARAGVPTSVVTVLANDPEATQPSCRWDRASGFTTAETEFDQEVRIAPFG